MLFCGDIHGERCLQPPTFIRNAKNCRGGSETGFVSFSRFPKDEFNQWLAGNMDKVYPA